jgi:hypothetical protein
VKLPEPLDRTPPHWRCRIDVAGLRPTAAHVDRATWWATCRFLALRSLLTSSEAPRAVWLNFTTVSRPEHASPTSPTACARGQPYSGHHRHQSALRRDRQKPSDLTRPSTGPLLPSVSRATAFSLCGYCSGEEGARVKRGKSQGVFAKSVTRLNSSPGVRFEWFS